MGFIDPFRLCFPYTEDYPRSQHLVVGPTVFSTNCSCATIVQLILVCGDDEVYHIHVSRVGMRPGGLVCIFCLNMVLVTVRSNSVHSAIRSSPWNYISQSHTFSRRRDTSFYLPIIALKSPISRSLSVLVMSLSVSFSWLLNNNNNNIFFYSANILFSKELLVLLNGVSPLLEHMSILAFRSVVRRILIVIIL